MAFSRGFNLPSLQPGRAGRLSGRRAVAVAGLARVRTAARLCSGTSVPAGLAFVDRASGFHCWPPPRTLSPPRVPPGGVHCETCRVLPSGLSRVGAGTRRGAHCGRRGRGPGAPHTSGAGAGTRCAAHVGLTPAVSGPTDTSLVRPCRGLPSTASPAKRVRCAPSACCFIRVLVRETAESHAAVRNPTRRSASPVRASCRRRDAGPGPGRVRGAPPPQVAPADLVPVCTAPGPGRCGHWQFVPFIATPRSWHGGHRRSHHPAPDGQLGSRRLRVKRPRASCLRVTVCLRFSGTNARFGFSKAAGPFLWGPPCVLASPGSISAVSWACCGAHAGPTRREVARPAAGAVLCTQILRKRIQE